MKYPSGPPLIFQGEFDQRSKKSFGIINGQKYSQSLLSGLWAPQILHLFFQFHQYYGFVLVW